MIIVVCHLCVVCKDVIVFLVASLEVELIQNMSRCMDSNPSLEIQTLFSDCCVQHLCTAILLIYVTKRLLGVHFIFCQRRYWSWKEEAITLHLIYWIVSQTRISHLQQKRQSL